MTQETWRPVVGFEGVYEVSDLGRVRSVDRITAYSRRDAHSGKMITVQRIHKGKILAPAAAPSGHLSVVLGRNKTKQVHALVLEAFVGRCPPGLEALHGNGHPNENTPSNLKWGTRSENLLDAVKHGAKAVGDKTWNAKLKNSDIPIIRKMFEHHSFSHIARIYGVSDTTIRQIRNCRTWKGF